MLLYLYNLIIGKKIFSLKKKYIELIKIPLRLKFIIIKK